MKRVFSSSSLWEAQEILALLAQQRIPATLINEYLAGTPGVLPFNGRMTVDAEVWVLDATLAPRSQRLIEEFAAAHPWPDPRKAWYCPGCEEENPASFDLCWACTHPR